MKLRSTQEQKTYYKKSSVKANVTEVEQEWHQYSISSEPSDTTGDTNVTLDSDTSDTLTWKWL